MEILGIAIIALCCVEIWQTWRAEATKNQVRELKREIEEIRGANNGNDN